MDNSRPWSDLPQAILGLIINKLEQFRLKVRALAVCKDWQHSKDYVTKPGCLPWVLRNQIVSFPHNPADMNSLICELIDPYSRQTYKLQNEININQHVDNLDLVASKQGWLLFNGNLCLDTVILYNPFTGGIHRVDTDLAYWNMKATMNTNPVSREFEVFMLAMCDGYLRIDTYRPSGLTSEIIGEMSYTYNSLFSVLYMNGLVYCLFVSGVLYSYNLEGKTWTLLDSKFPWTLDADSFGRECWLLEINANLVMVMMAVNEVGRWVIVHRFDWSEMSWVLETGLKNCGIYISGRVAFSAPLTNGSDEKLEECRLFYLNEQKEIKCYNFLTEAIRTVSEVQCEEEYSWIRNPMLCDCRFIEPPPYFVS